MADEDMVLGGGSDKKKEKGKMGMLPKILIIVGAALVLAVGGFFGWQFFMGGEETPPAQTETAAPAAQDGEAKPAEGGEGAAPAEKPGTIIKMEPFVVNLADPSGKRYLKLSLAVDSQDEKLKSEVEARIPQIRDSILLLLTSKSYADISTVSGKIRLRNEILKIFNRALHGVGSVHAVYFTEFVIQ